MKIGIIGYGHVGKAMHELFKDAVLFDEPLGIGNKEDINSCDIAFICVPTPMKENGQCDTSVVEEVISWLNVPLIVIRSTVYVGFTDEMINKYHKTILFQPEYYGETPNHPFAHLYNRNWLTFGGDSKAVDRVVEAYLEVMETKPDVLAITTKNAEMAKYMENAFLALKVTFCNEMYDVASALGCDYESARKAWTRDPRIGESHSYVYLDNRGYDGHCLPKDVSSIIYQADQQGVDVSLLKAMRDRNSKFRENN